MCQESPLSDVEQAFLPLKLSYGNVLEEYTSKTSLICVIANATSTRGYGFSALLEQRYPHADLYRLRRPLFKLTRAITCDRAVPPSVFLRTPSDEDTPSIAYLVCHFGPGGALEGNSWAQDTIARSTDLHYVAGLKGDTARTRLLRLRECLKSLLMQLQTTPVITDVIFPAGVTGGSWDDKYLSLIKSFAKCAAQRGVGVTVMKLPASNTSLGVTPAAPCLTPPASPPPRARPSLKRHLDFDAMAEEEKKLKMELDEVKRVFEKELAEEEEEEEEEEKKKKKDDEDRPGPQSLPSMPDLGAPAPAYAPAMAREGDERKGVFRYTPPLTPIRRSQSAPPVRVLHPAEY